jgi:hypothetical protein
MDDAAWLATARSATHFLSSRLESQHGAPLPHRQLLLQPEFPARMNILMIGYENPAVWADGEDGVLLGAMRDHLGAGAPTLRSVKRESGEEEGGRYWNLVVELERDDAPPAARL